jgi:hypothetical protein
LIDLFSFNVLHPDGICRLQKHEQQITNNKTFDKRNPPPLTVSCAPSGDEGPTVYIQTKERKTKTPKNKNNLFHVQKIIPVGYQIFRHIRRIEKHIPISVVERMSQQKTDGL